MKRKFWLRIQHNYPNALRLCIRDFIKAYEHQKLTTWREELKKPARLISYFRSTGIHIETNTLKGVFGASIKTNKIKVDIKPSWKNVSDAQCWAIDMGFYVLEQRLIGSLMPVLKPQKESAPEEKKERLSSMENDYQKYLEEYNRKQALLKRKR